MTFMLQTERVTRRLRPLVAVSLLGVAACSGRHRVQHLAMVKPIGDATCLSCHHQDQTFERTAHHLTSTLPTDRTIHGSFAPGENVLRTSNPDLHFRMDSTAEGFYQTAVMGHPPDTSSRAERFAFVVGSGRKGQSYLYWQGHSLYQLPVSYWVGLNKWINSPGYVDGHANFNRPITPRLSRVPRVEIRVRDWFQRQQSIHAKHCGAGSFLRNLPRPRADACDTRALYAAKSVINRDRRPGAAAAPKTAG